MSSLKVPAQPKPLPKTYSSTCILDSLTTARSKVMVCLPDLCFTDSQNLCKLHLLMIVLFTKAVQHQLHCQEQFKFLQNSNANFPQTHSWWNIWGHGHQVNRWNDWLEYCCQSSNLLLLGSPFSVFSRHLGSCDSVVMLSCYHAHYGVVVLVYAVVSAFHTK